MPDDAAPTSYCAAVRLGLPEPHRHYHDHQYGFPLDSDDALFGRLVLEINQAGLSWTTILRKAEAFERAFDGFRVARVAAYGDAEVARLLADAAIVRNRAKVAAVIHNAQRVTELQASFGSFHAWLERHHPQPLDAWVRLFKATFRFTGGEITREFLVSTGWLPGAHDADCEAYARALAAGPPWARGPAPASGTGPQA
ncbi:MAG: DNA-3-methyladenine glycosylase I [Nocardiopsis sp. BM-2018]|nr:MAG: DNA-3-methyladenine glycosylase I [Nocardiopsis sp. BM-2018]